MRLVATRGDAQEMWDTGEDEQVIVVDRVTLESERMSVYRALKMGYWVDAPDEREVKHGGPGPHANGSPQAVHGGGKVDVDFAEFFVDTDPGRRGLAVQRAITTMLAAGLPEEEWRSRIEGSFDIEDRDWTMGLRWADEHRFKAATHITLASGGDRVDTAELLPPPGTGNLSGGEVFISGEGTHRVSSTGIERVRFLKHGDGEQTVLRQDVYGGGARAEYAALHFGHLMGYGDILPARYFYREGEPGRGGRHAPVAGYDFHADYTVASMRAGLTYQVEDADAGVGDNLTNDEHLSMLAALDYLIGNVDRHDSNWLINAAGDIKAIDHGHAWAGRVQWQMGPLANPEYRAAVADIDWDRASDALDAVSPFLSATQETAARERIDRGRYEGEYMSSTGWESTEYLR